jgi:hypothetical protein
MMVQHDDRAISHRQRWERSFEYWALQPHRYKILRCGRRFGKTEFAKIWIGQGLLQGWECAWLAPQHKIWSEAYMEIKGCSARFRNQVRWGPPLFD